MRNKNIIGLILATILVMTIMPLSFAASGEIYVSPDGNDAAAGTFENPLRTLEAARDKARTMPEGVTIYLREGNYLIEDTLQLSSNDSGNVWKAYNDEEVHFQGGNIIDVSLAEKVTDQSVYYKIPFEARDKVIQIDLKAQGIDELGVIEQYGMGVGNTSEAYPQYANRKPIEPPVLYAGGELLTLARYPNGDEWLKTGKIYDTGSVPRNWLPDNIGKDSYVPPEERENPAIGPTFGYDDNRAERWVDAKDAWMMGMWYYDWAQCNLKISEIDTQKKRIICTETPSPYGIRKNQRYYVFNLIEELDVPGEYYIDRNSGMLYVYLPENYSGNISIATKDNVPIVNATGLVNTIFEGITFEVTKTTGFYGKNLNNVKFENCIFTNCGQYGAYISDSRNTGFNGCYVHSMTKSGIYIMGGGNSATLQSSGNYITNCYAHTMGMVEKTFVYPFYNYSLGGYVANNEAHNMPFGVSPVAVNVIIENNQFYDACKATDDCGVVGGGRSYIEGRGVKVRNNLIYDIGGLGTSGGTGVRAVMLDDTLSGVEISDNIFYNVMTGVSLNGGRDNIIENNIMYKTGFNRLGTIGINDFRSIAGNPYGTQLSELNSNQVWRNDLWKEAFPSLYSIFDKPDEYKAPGNNHITNNLFMMTDGIKAPEGYGEYNYVTNNYEGEAGVGLFKNENLRDFRLNDENSTLDLLGTFENIDVTKIGTSYRQLIRDSITMKLNSNVALMGNAAKYIDAENSSVKPVVKNGRTMVPVRFIAENFGADVKWDNVSQKVTINLGGAEVILTVNEKQISVNGQPKTIDESVYIENGRTLVPLRAVSEALGKEVFWNDNGLIVISENGTNLESKIDNKTAKQILWYFDNPYITPETEKSFKYTDKAYLGNANVSTMERPAVDPGYYSEPPAIPETQKIPVPSEEKKEDSIQDNKETNDNTEEDSNVDNTENKENAENNENTENNELVESQNILLEEYNMEEKPYAFGSNVVEFLSTEKAHSGNKSVKITKDTITLLKTFPRERNAILTVWIYDHANAAEKCSILFSCDDGSVEKCLGISTGASDCYIFRSGTEQIVTTVKRSEGWHQLKFDYSSGKDGKCYIDDVLVATFDDVKKFKNFKVTDAWGDNSVSNIFVDDIQVWTTE